MAEPVTEETETTAAQALDYFVQLRRLRHQHEMLSERYNRLATDSTVLGLTGDVSTQFHHVGSQLEMMLRRAELHLHEALTRTVQRYAFAVDPDAQPPRNHPEPATAEEISALPTRQLTSRDLTLPETGRQCAVCLEAFTPGLEVTRLPCRHLFCPECIRMWLERNASCPTCRGPIRVDAAEGPPAKREAETPPAEGEDEPAASPPSPHDAAAGAVPPSPPPQRPRSMSANAASQSAPGSPEEPLPAVLPLPQRASLPPGGPRRAASEPALRAAGEAAPPPPAAAVSPDADSSPPAPPAPHGRSDGGPSPGRRNSQSAATQTPAPPQQRRGSRAAQAAAQASAAARAAAGVAARPAQLHSRSSSRSRSRR
eukprot:TRINITY_DN50558_c0_g1_i1.p1 TRINITY_DN50558_c0_g1~~TRINITY_DN50558_c0_g1_i1.p1  ORF type:complete len:403 (+),score=68.42 TRINITY_DN50558_c0_g1_i1:101-1210(+)